MSSKDIDAAASAASAASEFQDIPWEHVIPQLYENKDAYKALARAGAWDIVSKIHPSSAKIRQSGQLSAEELQYLDDIDRIWTEMKDDWYPHPKSSTDRKALAEITEMIENDGGKRRKSHKDWSGCCIQ